jgi:hypothetical protein
MPSGYTGINRGAYGGNINSTHRYGWGGEPNRGNRPVRGPRRERNGSYGFIYYPVYGVGYDDNSGYDPYYDSDSASAAPYPPVEQPYDPYASGQDPSVETVPPQGYYPPVPYAVEPQQQAAPPVPEAPIPPLVLVLKNGQRREVKNYAIMNGMLWDFTTQSSHRIPLGSIDQAASAKATEDSGGSFPAESFGANPR